MAKCVILAVAGAGKTYHICHIIQPEKKNLILAYTHENIRNIKRELIEAHGSVPELTNVMTFDSFVYRFLLCPYEPTILRYFGREDFVRKGITTIDPPSQQIKLKSGKAIPNLKYVNKDKLEHYVCKSRHYYCATLTELIIQVKQGRDTLIKKAAASINRFYDQIMVDEFQDFREHNYELITALAQQVDNILLVGDYHQHSVSAVNNAGKPFKNRSGDVSYEDFKQSLISQHFEVDETTLSTSRRCCQQICDCVKEKLLIGIESGNERCGQVIWLNDNIESFLEDDSITKLVFKNANAYSFRAVNWSYSKGDTMSSVCVILTDKFDALDKAEFSCNGIPESTVNKLYVAMTRTKGNLYLIKNDTFNIVKDKYYKSKS